MSLPRTASGAIGEWLELVNQEPGCGTVKVCAKAARAIYLVSKEGKKLEDFLPDEGLRQEILQHEQCSI